MADAGFESGGLCICRSDRRRPAPCDHAPTPSSARTAAGAISRIASAVEADAPIRRRVRSRPHAAPARRAAWETRYLRSLLVADLASAWPPARSPSAAVRRRVTAYNRGVSALSLCSCRWPGRRASALTRAYERRFLFVGTDEYQRVIRGRGGPDRGGGDRLLRPRAADLARVATSWSRCPAAIARRRRPAVRAAQAAAPRPGARRVPAPGDRGRARAGGHRSSPGSCAASATTASRWSAPACRRDAATGDGRPAGVRHVRRRGRRGGRRRRGHRGGAVLPGAGRHALRRLAWQLERDEIDLVVASALVDVAGAAHHDPAGRRAADAARRAPAAGRRRRLVKDVVRPGRRAAAAGAAVARCCWRRARAIRLD